MAKAPTGGISSPYSEPGLQLGDVSNDSRSTRLHNQVVSYVGDGSQQKNLRNKAIKVLVDVDISLLIALIYSAIAYNNAQNNVIYG